MGPGHVTCGQQRLLNAAVLDIALSSSLNGTCCLNTLSFLKCSFGARVISRSHLCEAGLQHSASWVFAQAPVLLPLWAEVPFSEECPNRFIVAATEAVRLVLTLHNRPCSL